MSGGEGRLIEAFIVSAATEVGDKMTPVMMFCFAPEDAHLMQYKPVPGTSLPAPGAGVRVTGSEGKVLLKVTNANMHRLLVS